MRGRSGGARFAGFEVIASSGFFATNIGFEVCVAKLPVGSQRDSTRRSRFNLRSVQVESLVST